MAKFDSKEEILVKIGELYAKLSDATLSIEELDQLVSLSEDLYQRNIILRYKAFEQKVFGAAVTVPQPEEEFQQEITPEVEEPVANDTPVETPKVEEPKIEEEQPVFSFSLFEEEMEENPKEEIPAFDLSSDKIDAEQPPANPVVEQTTIVHSEEIVEEYNNHIEIDRSTVVENAQTHQVIREEHSHQTIVTDDRAVRLFVKRCKDIALELSTQYGVTKLDTLIGSFGLNERLQYINELFDGSSEEFSDAIKMLDQLSSPDIAFERVAEIGLRNSWDTDSETAAEFIQKICRRYA